MGLLGSGEWVSSVSWVSGVPVFWGTEKRKFLPSPVPWLPCRRQQDWRGAGSSVPLWVPCLSNFWFPCVLSMKLNWQPHVTQTVSEEAQDLSKEGLGSWVLHFSPWLSLRTVFVFLLSLVFCVIAIACLVLASKIIESFCEPCGLRNYSLKMILNVHVCFFVCFFYR